MLRSSMLFSRKQSFLGAPALKHLLPEASAPPKGIHSLHSPRRSLMHMPASTSARSLLSTHTRSRALCMLENTGSVARDILAAERTFLAWARTGLGFLGAGTALFAAYHQPAEQLTKAHTQTPAATDTAETPSFVGPVFPACLALWGNGAVTLTFAIVRYFSLEAAIRKGLFPVAKRGVVAIIFTTATSSTFALWVIVSQEYKAHVTTTGAASK